MGLCVFGKGQISLVILDDHRGLIIRGAFNG
jgi:hypothetical protein